MKKTNSVGVLSNSSPSLLPRLSAWWNAAGRGKGPGRRDRNSGLAGAQAVFWNNVWAIQPAMGGKKKVLAGRMRISLQPRMPTSMGRRLTAHNDQPVRKATMVPIPAPERSSSVR